MVLSAFKKKTASDSLGYPVDYRDEIKPGEYLINREVFSKAEAEKTVREIINSINQ